MKTYKILSGILLILCVVGFIAKMECDLRHNVEFYENVLVYVIEFGLATIVTLGIKLIVDGISEDR